MREGKERSWWCWRWEDRRGGQVREWGRMREGRGEERRREGKRKEKIKKKREDLDKAFLLATAIADFIILSIWCPLVATPPDLHVPGTEEELSVQVTLLNDIHVCDVDGSFWAGTETHLCKVLEQLTADCTCSDLGKRKRREVKDRGEGVRGEREVGRRERGGREEEEERIGG